MMMRSVPGGAYFLRVVAGVGTLRASSHRALVEWEVWVHYEQAVTRPDLGVGARDEDELGAHDVRLHARRARQGPTLVPVVD